MSWVSMSNYGGSQDRQRDFDRQRTMDDRMSGMSQGNNLGGRGVSRLMDAPDRRSVSRLMDTQDGRGVNRLMDTQDGRSVSRLMDTQDSRGVNRLMDIQDNGNRSYGSQSMSNRGYRDQDTDDRGYGSQSRSRGYSNQDNGSRYSGQDNGNRGYSSQNSRFNDSSDFDNYNSRGGGGNRSQSMPDEFETGIPLHLDKFSSGFDVITKICGNQGENLTYIEKTTGAKLRLSGRGTSTVDPITGRSSNDPAQIIITHPEMKGLELTEQLVESLLKSVQDDYAEHLESEYKSMENMLGLEDGPLPGGGGLGSLGALAGNLGGLSGGNLGGNMGNMGGMSGGRSGGMSGGMSGGLSDNQGFLGPSRMNDQNINCNYCDINCGDEALYNIHSKGALHRQKLSEFQARLDSNERSQSQMGRSSTMREPMSMTTKRELEQTFAQLMYRQLQPAYVTDLRERCEYLAQSKPKPNLLPRTPSSRQGGFCTICSKNVGRDIQSHMWSRDHREMYLMLQLNLGLKKFSQEYGNCAVPDMDTNGGRRLATTSLDDYFLGLDSLPADVDPDLYKEVVILLGFAYKFECKISKVSFRDEAKWVQHCMSVAHGYNCITAMMDMGVSAYINHNGDVPCISKAVFQETIKKYFDVDEGEGAYGGSWKRPKVFALSSLTPRLVAHSTGRHLGTVRCSFNSFVFLYNWKLRLKLSQYSLLVEFLCFMQRLHADIIVRIARICNNRNFNQTYEYHDGYESSKKSNKYELCSLLNRFSSLACYNMNFA